MKRRLAWFSFVALVTAAIQTGTQRVLEASTFAYRVPPRVAQDVASIVLAKYARDCSWEKAHYTYYIATTDKRVDVERLIRDMPSISNVLFLKYSDGVPLQTLPDVMGAKLKSIATIGFITGSWKRVQVPVGRYVSPIGITHGVYIVERRWWGWAVVDEVPSSIIS